MIASGTSSARRTSASAARRRCRAISSSAIAWLVACGAAHPPAPEPTPPSPVRDAEPPPPADDPAFDITIGGGLSTTATTVPLVAASKVHAGDRMYVTVETSKRATVYVGYCDVEQHFAIYPPADQPPLLAGPGAKARAPRDEYFVADHAHGIEQVVVIVSSGDLARTDPKLEELVSHARANAKLASCEASAVVATTNESREQAGLPPVPPPKAKKHVPPAGAKANEKRLQPGSAWLPRGWNVSETVETKTIRSDDAGIATWMFTLQHE
jgi:hypothetical protein